MRRGQPEQRKTRLEGQAPWWSKYAAQIVVGVVVTVAGGALTMLVGTDAPAMQCEANSQPVTDYRNRIFGVRYYCSISAGSPVYANVSASQAAEPLDDTGYMNQAPSIWVICQLRGRPNPPAERDTDTQWLYTQGDAANSNTHGYTNGWGYLPAAVVTQARPNTSLSAVPPCSEYY